MARTLAAASAAGLQVAFIRLLVLGFEPDAIPAAAPSAAATVLVPVSLRSDAHFRKHRPRTSGAQGHGTLRLARPAHILSVRTDQRARTHRKRQRINWLRALRTEYRYLEFHPVIRTKTAIGFQLPVAPASHQHHFGWDYASTHRIQGLASGGIQIMISDRCAIVFAPFPLIGCLLGKIDVNGDLFKHMNDRRDPGTMPLP